MTDTYDPFEGPARQLQRRYGSVDRVVLPPGPNDIADTILSVPRGILTGAGHAATSLGQASGIEMGQPEITSGIGDKEQFAKAMEQGVFGPLHQPQTIGGKYGEVVGEVLGNPANWVGPGGTLYKAGFNALSGLSSEAGGQLYKDKPEERVARPAGSWIPSVAERALPFLLKRLPTGVAPKGILAPLE